MDATTKTLEVEVAAQMLGVSRASAYRYAAKGEIPAIRLGKRLLILREPFERMLAGQQAPMPAASNG